jgi:hypothetical protein
MEFIQTPDSKRALGRTKQRQRCNYRVGPEQRPIRRLLEQPR